MTGIDYKPRAAIAGDFDHGGLAGLTDDDHAQYALLAGRSGGQTLQGDTASGGALNLRSTAHSTQGLINAVGSALVVKPTASWEAYRLGAIDQSVDIYIGKNQTASADAEAILIGADCKQIGSSVVVGHYAARAISNVTGETVILGNYAAYAAARASKSVLLGSAVLYAATGTIDKCVMIGREAGGGVTAGLTGCIIIGDQAGFSNTSNNRLYIHNASSTTPLIYGEFDNKLAQIHGSLSVATGEKTSFTTMARVGGALLVSTTSVGNVGSGEDDLISQSLPAAALSNNGESVEIESWGTFAANVNAKNVKQYFGATAIFATGSLLFNSGSWRIKSRVVRTGATTQVSVSVFDGDLTLLTATCQTASPAATLANAVTIKCTGEATSNNDIVQLGQIIKFLPA